MEQRALPSNHLSGWGGYGDGYVSLNMKAYSRPPSPKIVCCGRILRGRVEILKCLGGRDLPSRSAF